MYVKQRDANPDSRPDSRFRRPTAQLVRILALAPLAALTAAADAPPANQSPEQQVAATERAFAKTMADRDLAAFGRFISQEAVFVSDERTLRGQQQVIDGWRKLYQGASAPFSWEPQTIEVLSSGRLAMSSGPVHDAAGKLAGKYTSIWRLEAPDTWRIVFDSGCEVCARCAVDSH
jgi:ketosteroid isomerase-like protein